MESSDDGFCHLVQKLQFENEPNGAAAAQLRHCRALRSASALKFKKALQSNGVQLAMEILGCVGAYSRVADGANGTAAATVKDTLKQMDNNKKVDRSSWKSILSNLKLQSTDLPPLPSDAEIQVWHSQVVEGASRVDSKLENALRPLKRKLPPSQDVQDADSPPAPAPSRPAWPLFQPKEPQGGRLPPRQQPSPTRDRSFFKPLFQGANREREIPPLNKPAPKELAPLPPPASAFKSARVELAAQNIKKYGHSGGVLDDPPKKRSLGGRRGPPSSSSNSGKFVPHKSAFGEDPRDDEEMEDELDERLKNIAPDMIKMIRNEIMDIGKPVNWEDIAGLEAAKTTIQEIVVWPLLRPDIFAGLRGPPKGILLFGPPGTGKTLIGKCIASQSKSTFFSISASCLTSKWVGEGEKMVRALFAVARCHQPAVIFIDEVDSLLSQRSETEHESSRRIKTEFLVQLDGATTAEDERILVVGATNRPQELDEAARRRLVKRLYVPLPDARARAQIIVNLMSKQSCELSEVEVREVAHLAEGFSGADMRDLCREAAYGPIRSITETQMERIHVNEVRPVTVEDFRTALQQVRPSVSSKDLQSYEDWNKTYGYGA